MLSWANAVNKQAHTLEFYSRKNGQSSSSFPWFSKIYLWAQRKESRDQSSTIPRRVNWHVFRDRKRAISRTNLYGQHAFWHGSLLPLDHIRSSKHQSCKVPLRYVLTLDSDYVCAFCHVTSLEGSDFRPWLQMGGHRVSRRLSQRWWKESFVW